MKQPSTDASPQMQAIGKFKFNVQMGCLPTLKDCRELIVVIDDLVELVRSGHGAIQAMLKKIELLEGAE